MAKFNDQGELIYATRTDFQVKIRGQRVETAEVENCITSSSPDILDCIVMKVIDEKLDSEYLVAYIQCSKLPTETICDLKSHVIRHCQIHLPTYMVPVTCILLDKIPLTQTGKKDRKSLPTLSLAELRESSELLIWPQSKTEQEVHALWSKLFQQNKISMNTSFFWLGGDSLALARLYQEYRASFDFNTEQLNIAKLFQNTTVTEHAMLLNTYRKTDHEPIEWKSLHIKEGNSIAQWSSDDRLPYESTSLFLQGFFDLT